MLPDRKRNTRRSALRIIAISEPWAKRLAATPSPVASKPIVCVCPSHGMEKPVLRVSDALAQCRAAIILSNQLCDSSPVHEGPQSHLPDVASISALPPHGGAVQADIVLGAQAAP